MVEPPSAEQAKQVLLTVPELNGTGTQIVN
jgi:hypothetical protein